MANEIPSRIPQRKYPPEFVAAQKSFQEKSDRVYRERLQREADANASPGLFERLAARVYSPTTKPPEPQPRYWVANTLICTPGNLTTISAQAKAGKSAVIGAMIASTFAEPDADCLGFASQNPDGKAVVHIDTEQCPFDHWQGIQRAVRRAKAEAAPSWLRSYCLTGFSAADVRSSIRILMEQDSEQFAGIHSVFIDGIADAVPDVNDQETSSSLITELHELAIEFDCPILSIVHLNPGSEFKTRGHLGSQLERKSETNLRLKQEGGISVIFADKNRRAPIAEKSGPCFGWSDTAGMHISIQNPASAKAEAKSDAKLEAMRRDAESVFAEGKKPALAHKELVTLLGVAFDLKPAGARRRVENWLSSQVVFKQDSGLYTLTA